jgi:hypothetical protein
VYRSLVVTLAAALAAACGGGGSGAAPAELAGSWGATRLEFVSASAPATRVELIVQGASLTVVLSAGGTFDETLQVPGEPEEIRSGTWSATGDVLTLNYSPTNQMQFGYTLAGDTLTLGGADGEFDFDDDGSDEAAKVNVTLIRL